MDHLLLKYSCGGLFSKPNTSSSGRIARREGGVSSDFRYPYFIGYFEHIFNFREFEIAKQYPRRPVVLKSSEKRLDY
jgi:hypothetical protein